MNPHNTFDVASYMRTSFLTIPPTSTLSSAVHAMKKANEHWAVVIDEEKTVLGVVSSWDIIERLVPEYLENDQHLGSFTSYDMFSSRIHEIADHSITSLMTKHVKTVRATDSLMKAATLMAEFRLHCLPVVDEKGRLLGSIKQSELRTAICDCIDE